MATGEWNEVDAVFEGLGRYLVLHPTLAAMRRLVDAIKSDVAIADVHPTVSHAWLVLSVDPDQKGRRVMVWWLEDSGYNVSYLDPPFEISEATAVPEGSI